MSDTPDFDKMSPEEIMKWMESLAVRQGATEGLTTSADMDVGNVSEDDERLKNTGEYIPYGMKKADWDKQKAKEDEEKRQRQAAQPPKPVPAAARPPVPPPAARAPVPPPAQPVRAVAQPAAANDTPDFDKMSPDEIMKWMESLAVRQGVTQGLLTSADMDVGSVSEDDERLKDKGEYMPYGMKKEDWEKQKAREDEEKRQRIAQQSAAKAAQPPAAVSRPAPTQPAVQPPAPVQPPVQQPAASIQPPSALDDFLSGDLPTFENMDEEETVQAHPGANPVDWLTSLSDPDESFNFDALPDNSFNFNSLNDADDPLAALAQLSSNDSLDMNWLTEMGNADDGLGALANLAAQSSPADADADPLAFLNSLAEPTAPAAPVRPSAPSVGPKPGENSLEWLESMARDHGATDEELITPANLNVIRPTETRPDGRGYTPYSFETASDSTSSEQAAVPNDDLGGFFNQEDEMSEDWLDGVARNVATGEQPTAAVPMRLSPEPTPAPKQEDVVNDVMSQLNNAKDVDPADINRMFEALFERAEQYKDKDEVFDAAPATPVHDDTPAEALKAEIPDWLREQMITSAPAASSDATKMDDLMKMFDEEIPAESFTAQAAKPTSEMPDWLRQTPDDAVPAVVNNLPVDNNDLPDWLQAAPGEGSDENIFAETDMAWATSGTGGMDADSLFADQFLTDESDDLGALMGEDNLSADETFQADKDPWVVALTLEEEAEDQLAQWYAEKTGTFSEENIQANLPDFVPALTPAAAQPMRTGALKAAQFPVEAVLMLGEVQAAPDWLIGGAGAIMPAASAPIAAPVMPAASEDDIPDWLREANDPVAATVEDTGDDLPDWLRGQVDDSVTQDANDLPPWLANEDAVEPENEDLPDWLRETMVEDEAAASFTPTLEPARPTVIAPAPKLPTPVAEEPAAIQPVAAQPRAIQPVPVKASPAPMMPVNIDVASTLQAARGKVSSGDVDSSLADYEMIVRANTALDEVVNDLAKLSEHKDHKRNPAVHRVLGDTHMRRGDLKSALETYRKALHML